VKLQAQVKLHPSAGYVQGTLSGPFSSHWCSHRPQAVPIADPDVHPLAYADDAYLTGSASAVTAAFPTLVQQGAVVTLTPSLHECAVCSTPDAPAHAAALQTAHILSIQHAI
jgi:hypothetical protein